MLFAQDREPDFARYGRFGDSVKFRREPVLRGTVDYFLGAQYVLSQGSGAKPTLSASYVRRLYDGVAPEPDFGSPTNSLLLLGSGDVKGFHYDANAFVNELV
jgi:hypothetical protein